MKKIGLICLLLITVSAHAENCANNRGVVVVVQRLISKINALILIFCRLIGVFGWIAAEVQDMLI